MNTSHYPSLELCKKLTEIGFPETEQSRRVPINEMETNIYVFPSLMEMLDVLKLDKHEWELTMPEYIKIIQRDVNEYELEFSYGNVYCWKCHYIRGTNLPNALAEMILWLHENKHISF